MVVMIMTVVVSVRVIMTVVVLMIMIMIVTVIMVMLVIMVVRAAHCPSSFSSTGAGSKSCPLSSWTGSRSVRRMTSAPSPIVATRLSS